MTATTRQRWELTVLTALACVLAGACGGDGEPSGEADDDEAPVDADTASAPDDTLSGPIGADLDDPAVDEWPEGIVGAEHEDSAGFEGEDPFEDTVPGPLQPIRIPAGTRINASPGRDISTAEYRVDDPVIVAVTHDVLGPNGELLIPEGVRLLGRVRASMGSGGPGENPVLEIDFETLSADRYERPVEGVVVNRPVILDPVAARRRRSASGRLAARTMVPGLIMAGTIIVVELRAPVDVPPPDS